MFYLNINFNTMFEDWIPILAMLKIPHVWPSNYRSLIQKSTMFLVGSYSQITFPIVFNEQSPFFIPGLESPMPLISRYPLFIIIIIIIIYLHIIRERERALNLFGYIWFISQCSIMYITLYMVLILGWIPIKSSWNPVKSPWNPIKSPWNP